MSNPSGTTRRTLLALLAGSSTAAFAGCGALTGDGGGDADPTQSGVESPETDGTTDTASPAEAGENATADAEGNATAGAEPEAGPQQVVGVSTWAPTAVGDRSARLRGALTDLAGVERAACYYQFRPVGAAEWTVTAGRTRTTPGEFEQRLAGLDPATLYEFRAVGDAGETVAVGEPRTFRTRAARDRSPLSTDGLTLFFDDGSDGRTAVAEVPVENVGRSAVGRLTLEVTWRDDDGEPIGTTTDRLHTLRPGETWLAQITPRSVGSDRVRSITADTTVEGEPPRAPSGLSVTASDLRIGEYRTEVRGVVENTHGESGASVRPIARVFDAAGHILGDSKTYAFDIPTDGKRRFVAGFYRRTAQRIEAGFDHEVVLERA